MPRFTGEPRAGQQHVISAEQPRGETRGTRQQDQSRAGCPGRGDPAEPTWAACWLTAGRLVAILTVNRPRDLQQGRRVIASADPVDAERLADPAIPVKDAVAV